MRFPSVSRCRRTRLQSTPHGQLARRRRERNPANLLGGPVGYRVRDCRKGDLIFIFSFPSRVSHSVQAADVIKAAGTQRGSRERKSNITFMTEHIVDCKFHLV